MQSNGGVMAPEMAARFACRTLLSGPAGGPVAGIFCGTRAGYQDLITMDMGGTSFDVSFIKNGQVSFTREGSVGGDAMAFPVLDIRTVGAGGGSIAVVDEGGVLQVGPASAGANPGPICYRRGGTVPTVTDADLVLGYLGADDFLGGKFRLDLVAAENGIAEKIAAPLSIDTLSQEGVRKDDIELSYGVDLKYIGQFHEVTIPFDAPGESFTELKKAFDAQHRRLYSYNLPDQPAEALHWRLTAVGRTERPLSDKRTTDSSRSVESKRRQVVFDGVKIEAQVFDGAGLSPSMTVHGPAIVE